jgi:hypothetical protein
MFNIVTGFLLALDSKFDRGSCLSHVGTEGSDPTTAETASRRAPRAIRSFATSVHVRSHCSPRL